MAGALPGISASNGWLLFAVCLVPVYVNTFDVWRWLLNVVPYGGAPLVPVVAAVAIALWGVLRTARRRGGTGAWWALAAAVVLGLAALAMLDPRYPAKRIHLVEYVVLALVVRRAAVERLSATGSLVATAAIAALLGFHDELLQGIHADRRFALGDVGVNALAGCAGALLGHATGLFAGRQAAGPYRDLDPAPAVAAAGWMLAASGLAAFAIGRLVGTETFPLWIHLPVFGAGLFWILVRDGGRATGARWAADVIVLIGLATAVVPGLVNVTAIDFR